jgi:hypothetical protein
MVWINFAFHKYVKKWPYSKYEGIKKIHALFNLEANEGGDGHCHRWRGCSIFRFMFYLLHPISVPTLHSPWIMFRSPQAMMGLNKWALCFHCSIQGCSLSFGTRTIFYTQSPHRPYDLRESCCLPPTNIDVIKQMSFVFLKSRLEKKA